MFLLLYLFVSFFYFESQAFTADQEGSPQLPPIKEIHVDPTILFKIRQIGMMTSIIAASNGMLERTKHTLQFAAKTTETDLYPLIDRMPARNRFVTYTDGLATPRILTDWYSGDQNIALRVNAFLQTSKHSLASLTRAVVYVLSTPEIFAANHLPIQENVLILNALKKRFDVQLCLSGNYPHPVSFNHHHGKIVEFFDAQHLSGEIKQVKPSPAFFESVILQSEYASEEILCIETEKMHCPPTELGLRSIVVDPKDPHTLLVGLLENGFHLKPPAS